MFATIIASITSLVAAHGAAGLTGLFASGLAAGAVPFIGGNVLTWLLDQGWAQRLLGRVVNQKWAGVALSVWVKTGPLKLALLPIAFILLLFGFVILSILDGFIDNLDVTTQKMLNSVAVGLQASGSTDRFGYVASKMALPPVPPPSPAGDIAAAIAAPTAAPDPEAAKLAADAAAASIAAELKS